MKIQLGSFFCWRVKRLLLLIFCMGCGQAAAIAMKRDDYTVYWMCGFAVYVFLENLLGIKNACCEALVEEQENEIRITYLPQGLLQKIFFGFKRECVIAKKEIQNVRLKEIQYGGRWLDIIGYRLVVKADKTYRFDSLCLKEGESAKDCSLNELKKVFEAEKKENTRIQKTE